MKFNTDTREIFLYGEIGPAHWGLIDSDTVSDALSEMEGSHVRVRLNTPGGSVDEGIAIFNALKRHRGGITMIVDSLAASMGSYLLQAGSTRIVASNAMVMVHDPWSIAIGNATEFRKAADVLDKYAQRMIPDYAKRSGKSEAEIQAIMAEESWYAGQEIIDAGFADEVDDGIDVEPVVTSLHRIARKIPKSLKAAAVAAKHSKPPIRVRWNTKSAIARFPRRELARRKLADVAMDLLDLT